MERELNANATNTPQTISQSRLLHAINDRPYRRNNAAHRAASLPPDVPVSGVVNIGALQKTNGGTDWMLSSNDLTDLLEYIEQLNERRIVLKK